MTVFNTKSERIMCGVAAFRLNCFVKHDRHMNSIFESNPAIFSDDDFRNPSIIFDIAEHKPTTKTMVIAPHMGQYYRELDVVKLAKMTREEKQDRLAIYQRNTRGTIQEGHPQGLEIGRKARIKK